MRAVLAAAGLVTVAVLSFGDAFRSMFTAPPPVAQVAVSPAQANMAYSGASAPFVQLPEPVQYAEVEVAESGRWALSDVAMLAIFGALMGAVISYDSKAEARAVAEPDVELANNAARIAALAVGGQSAAKQELVTLAKDLNPVVGYWDPLGLSDANFWNQGNEATIGFLRHAEIKHGRVAMAAFVGYLAHANGVHFPWKMPGDELAGPGCNPVELWENLPRLAKAQIILVLGWFEYYGEAGLSENPKHKHYMRGGKPGVYPSFKEEPFPAPHPVPFSLFDPFGIQKNKSDEWKAEKLKTEVNNGRLAMIGIMSLLSESAIPGSVPALKGLIPSSGAINVMDPFHFATCVKTCVPI
jgi:hypothetical protein